MTALFIHCVSSPYITHFFKNQYSHFPAITQPRHASISPFITNNYTPPDTMCRANHSQMTPHISLLTAHTLSLLRALIQAKLIFPLQYIHLRGFLPFPWCFSSMSPARIFCSFPLLSAYHNTSYKHSGPNHLHSA